MTERRNDPRSQQAAHACLVLACLLTMVGALLPFPYLGLLAFPAIPAAAALLAAGALLRHDRDSEHPALGKGLTVLGRWLMLGAAVCGALERATLIEAGLHGRLLTDTPRVLFEIVFAWVAGIALAVLGSALATSALDGAGLLQVVAYGATLPASWVLVGALSRVWPLTN